MVQAGEVNDATSFGWAAFGGLPGDQSMQSVPRAELFAVLQVARCTAGRVLVVTDHLNIAKLWAKGEGILLNPRLGNGDLWYDLHMATKLHSSFSIVWCPSHLDRPGKHKPTGITRRMVIASMIVV